MSIKPQIAKLTRPLLSGVVERRRLFARLDRVSRTKIAWISAPAGSGKTTLAANWLDARKLPCLWYQADEGDADIATFFSYLGIAAKHAAPRYRKPLPLLTREYLSGVAAFSKRFFETLFGRLKPPFCLVLDNYQDVPPESQFHEAVREGLGTAPAGAAVIIISRSDPPPQMSRLHLNGRMDIIGAKEMGFTLEESRKLIASLAKEKPRDEVVETLFQRTDGWAAGLLLLTRSSALKEGLVEKADVPVEELYDYFATEVYERTDDEMRAFLLVTAFLPTVTVRAADVITGRNNSDQLLSRLSRANFFTERRAAPAFVSYQYHPLFRDFLLKKAWDRFSHREINGIRKKAAAALEAEGQTEDAARLLIDAGEWRRLTELIVRHAAGLMTAGRFRVLETWMEKIPEKMMEQSAWLQYWKASCHITAKPVEARGVLEQAYALSLEARDPTGSFLSWTGVVNTFLYEWRDFRPLDRWIAAFSDLSRQYGSFPSTEVEERAVSAIFAALMYRRPQHPDLPAWARQAQTIMQSTGNPTRRLFLANGLILYNLWTGRISEAGLLVSLLSPAVKSLEGSPLSRLMCLRSMSLYSLYASQPETGLKTVEQGLGLARESGVHHMDFMFHGVAIYHAAALGDASLARDHLERMASLVNPQIGYAAIHFAGQSALAALLEGDQDEAVSRMEDCMRLTEQAGVPLILLGNQATLAMILFQAKRYGEASHFIAEMRKGATECRCAHVEAWCASLEAQLALIQADDALFADRFSRAVEICRRTGLRLVALLPDTRVRMFSKALDLDIEKDFVREQIGSDRLMPGDPGAMSDRWPWPVRIHALGGFTIFKHDEMLTFSGRVQQRPLAMIKAIVAFGGKDASEEQIADALWPDADGDAGHRSFDTTLHRLRRLINNDNAIVLREGRLSLDERYCWVDVRAFERALGSAEEAWEREGQEDAVRLTEKAIAIYRGHFLPGDMKEPWTVSIRERLRTKFMHCINRLGRHWMEAGQYDKAARVFGNGLDKDDLVEEFYQQLMVCYHQLGQQAEAVKVYHRCRSVLDSSLGLRPSSKTEEIYNSVRQGK